MMSSLYRAAKGALASRLPGRGLILAGLRDLRRRPWQSGLMVLGVALGVAVVIAIDLANGAARRGFELSTEAVVGRASHQIQGGPSGVPQEFYRRLRVDLGVRTSAPIVEGIVYARDFGDQPLRVLGVDPFAERPFRDYLAGMPGVSPGFEAFYLQSNAVLIGSPLASRWGLQPGGSFRVQANGRLVDLQVLGVVEPAGERDALALEDLLIMDVAGAQELLGMQGRLSRIDLILQPQEASALTAALPPGLRLKAASEQAQTATQLTEAFLLNLAALSLLALVVGMFLIYNTMTFSVVQRRQVFGTLRVLGATADQVFWVVLLEAAGASALGALLGVGLGWLLGQGAVGLVTQTINDLYFVLSVRQVTVTASTLVKAMVLGVGAGVLAAAVPALEAARVPPVTLFQRSSLEARARAAVWRLALAGVTLGGLGAAALAAFQSSLAAAFAGLFAILVGFALLVPALIVLLMRALGEPLGRALGFEGRMAARTIVGALSRTGVAVAALMVALAVTVGVSVMIESFRGTVVNWLELTLPADLYVTAPTAGGTRPSLSLPYALKGQLEAVPGVASVESFRSVQVEGPMGPVQLSVADARRRRDARLYRFAQGSPEAVWAQVQQGAVIVSEPFAYRHGIPPSGGEVTLYTDRGEHTFPVVAVYYDYSSDRGAVLMSENVYHQYWDDRSITSLAVYVSPGESIDFVADKLRRSLAGTGLTVLANRALREQALRIFDRTFAITAALRLLAVLVAFIGVLSALMALQLERSRELATLQALGLTPAGLWRLTLVETGLMGAAAGLFSWPAGLIMAAVLVYVINLRSFGWTLNLQLQPWILMQALAVGVAAALAAALYPTARLARMPISRALREE